ncbi:MAG TPA: maleylpyruvate isomerase N-terminal domain-containing protein [Anaerolineales bacterium]
MDPKEFQSWVRENTAEREHMKKIAAGLSDEELSRPMGAGWTAAAILAHLAFWDARAITLILKWQKEGVGESPIDTDVINEATRELSLAIPPHAAAELAVEKAAALDAIIEKLSPEWVDRIVEIGKTVHLKRFPHRREHLDEIGKVLGKE